MYKLSNLAAQDFSDIFEYTLLSFGTLQADIYTQELEETFRLISETPLMGTKCPEISDGVRRHDHQKHSIFYQVRATDIFIIRILHQQMAPMKHFF